jgi:hypothetical protein
MIFKIEEILMVIVAFLIGWFSRTMISGGLVEGKEVLQGQWCTNDYWRWYNCSDEQAILPNGCPSLC